MNSIDTRRASENGVIFPIILLNAVDMLFMFNPLRARQILVSKLSNRLQLATASLCTVFGIIYQKFTRAEFN